MCPLVSHARRGVDEHLERGYEIGQELRRHAKRRRIVVNEVGALRAMAGNRALLGRDRPDVACILVSGSPHRCETRRARKR